MNVRPSNWGWTGLRFGLMATGMLVLLGGLWAGLLRLGWAGGPLAIALEARVKFSAPTVTKEIGLDVGRHVFGTVNKAEIGLAIVLLGAEQS